MDFAVELQKLQDSGIRFTLHRHDDELFVVRSGDYRQNPHAEAVLQTFEQAVSWLQEQVKARYPESAYAKRLLTN